MDGQPGDWPPKPHQCPRELGALTLDFVVVNLKNHSAWSHGINRYLEQRFSVLGISAWIWGRGHKAPPNCKMCVYAHLHFSGEGFCLLSGSQRVV